MWGFSFVIKSFLFFFLCVVLLLFARIYDGRISSRWNQTIVKDRKTLLFHSFREEEIPSILNAPQQQQCPNPRGPFGVRATDEQSGYALRTHPRHLPSPRQQLIPRFKPRPDYPRHALRCVLPHQIRFEEMKVTMR